jgi:hypothetical protein
MAAYSRKPIPKATIAFIIVWNVVIGSVLLTVVLRQRAWGFLPVFVVSAGLFAIIMVRRRRSIAPLLATSTGDVVLAPIAPVLSGEPDRRWVGSGAFPGWFGMMEATTPLAVLEVFGNALRLRLRPRVLGLMFGVEPLVAKATDMEEVFSVSRLVRVGIGFRPRGGPSYYLWTSHRDEALSALEAAGFPVTWQARKRDRRQ